MRKSVSFAAMAALLVVVCANDARAQLYEDVGTRAQGMAGAFVGVADDATAVWWNPAGLASGAFFNALFEHGRVTQPESPTATDPARRSTTSGFSVALPSLGLSYYHLRVSEIVTSTDSSKPNRQDDGGEAQVRSLAFSQFGVTVGQSLLDHLVLGSTFKVIRGGRRAGGFNPAGDILDQADGLDVAQETHADLDAGLMMAFPHVQAGVTVRNVTTPEFGDGADRFELKRHVRAGGAFLARPGGVVNGLTVAADADLTRTATAYGEVRHVATGGEVWLAGRRVGLRAGVAANTIGERRPATSTGVSVKTISSIYIDAARTFGSDQSIRGWSTTVRIAF